MDIEELFEQIKIKKEKDRIEKLSKPCQLLYPHYKIGFWTTFCYSPLTVKEIRFNQNEGYYEYRMMNTKYCIWKTEDEITLCSD